MMRVAIIRFPGSNCDADTLRAIQQTGARAYYVWHREEDLREADAVIIPGGFAFGDYLRAGAIARFSPILAAVQAHAHSGLPVLGICNGFQVLCEAGLLPGALVRNAGLTFVSRPVRVRIETTGTPFTAAYHAGAIFRAPIAHGQGRYVASEDVVEALEATGRVVLRYVDENPNGSMNAIAGVTDEAHNVVGIMPHPERATSELLGETAGALVFESLTRSLEVSQGGTR
jgi:phosphoribosylformylglycinamidine synthase